MAEVKINIHGRTYGISCENGQEARVAELGRVVDSRLKEIARAGAASNESHLLVLASLMIADEVFDLRDTVNKLKQRLQSAEFNEEDDAMMAATIDLLADRIERIASRIQAA
jgi:cell division protein ZapA